MWLDIEFNDLLKSRIFYNLSLLLPFLFIHATFNIFMELTHGRKPTAYIGIFPTLVLAGNHATHFNRDIPNI